MKNRKSPGIDRITHEQLKHGPSIIKTNITEILNETASTGLLPNKLDCCILIPLQKPGKARGPSSNLMPIILLSILRKILSICLLKTILNKLYDHNHSSQAAYPPGHGITKEVLTMKLLAEEVITSCNYTTRILMMNMSKAFDAVRRSKIIEDLKAILNEDGLHLIKILTKDVELAVMVENETGEAFNTNIGTPQGDDLSPILFTLYLAKALEPDIPAYLLDHGYASTTPQITIPLHMPMTCWISPSNDKTISDIKLIAQQY